MKYYKGSYLILSENKYPPAIIVVIDEEKLFDKIVSRIDKEAFIRVRNVKNNYSKLILNSIGDLSQNPSGFPDYNKCELNLGIEVEGLDKRIIDILDRNPTWLFLIKNTIKGITLTVNIDKQSEKVIKRKLLV